MDDRPLVKPEQFIPLSNAHADMSDIAPRSEGPTSVVFDTDMATDCDDAGALAMLHTLERRGEAQIRATVVNNEGAYSAGVVAAVNAFYGRPDVPLGAYQGDDVGTDAAEFFADIARDTATYGHTVVSRDQVPGAVDVYRQVLAEAASDEIVVVSVGHLNNLHELLESEPDQHSPLPGRELVEQKVGQAVVMGGEYPSGREHNFAGRGSARYTRTVLDRWPTPVLFSGFEVGKSVSTGPRLGDLSGDHPVRRAYAGHQSDPLANGRPSWDQTAVLAAVRDPELYWDLSAPGRVVVEPDGSNAWTTDPNGPHAYLIERQDPAPAEVADIIEDMMVDMSGIEN